MNNRTFYIVGDSTAESKLLIEKVCVKFSSVTFILNEP